MNYSFSSSFLRRTKAVIAESAISPSTAPTPVEPVRGESELEAVEGAVVDVVSVVVSVVVVDVVDVVVSDVVDVVSEVSVVSIASSVIVMTFWLVTVEDDSVTIPFSTTNVMSVATR